jgi:mono/diheme cytochrome c family protein
MTFQAPARRLGAAIASLALGLAGLWAGPAAADTERGKMLYETRCIGCHTSSVHKRSARGPKSYDRLQAQVRRWSAEAGGSWSGDDIDDMTLYLNQRYYRFPCAHKSCKADQASLAR